MAEKTGNKNETFTTNGKTYKKLPNGKVRLVKTNSLEAINELDIKTVIEKDFKKMTADLYRFILANEPKSNPGYKNGFTIYRTYKIKYSEKGLTITDEYNREVKTNLKRLPKAKDVFEFLQTLRSAKANYQRKKEEQVDKTNHFLQEINTFLKGANSSSKVTVTSKYERLLTDVTIEEEVKQKFIKKFLNNYPYLLPKETIDLNKQRQIAIAFAEKNKGDTSKIIDRLQNNFIPHRSFTVLYNKVLKQFNSKKIRSAKFYNEVIDLLKNDYVYDTDRLKYANSKAPKFTYKPNFHIDTIIEETETTITFQNTSGAEFTVSKSEVLVRDLLEVTFLNTENEKSRSMLGITSQICKFLQGVVTKEQLLAHPYQYDKHYVLEYSDLEKHNEDLAEICQLLLWQEESYGSLDILYKNEITYEVGTRVRVVFPGSCSYQEGKIIKYDRGNKVLYDNGSAEHLLKANKVFILSTPKN